MKTEENRYGRYCLAEKRPEYSKECNRRLEIRYTRARFQRFSKISRHFGPLGWKSDLKTDENRYGRYWPILADRRNGRNIVRNVIDVWKSVIPVIYPTGQPLYIVTDIISYVFFSFFPFLANLHKFWSRDNSKTGISGRKYPTCVSVTLFPVF